MQPCSYWPFWLLSKITKTLWIITICQGESREMRVKRRGLGDGCLPHPQEDNFKMANEISVRTKLCGVFVPKQPGWSKQPQGSQLQRTMKESRVKVLPLGCVSEHYIILATWEWEANMKGLEIFDVLPVGILDCHFLMTSSSTLTSCSCFLLLFPLLESAYYFTTEAVVTDISKQHH